MKHLYAFLYITLLLIGYSGNAQNPVPETAPVSNRYFDPAQDPVGVVQPNGAWLLTVSEATLTRALRLGLPEIGPVERISKQVLWAKDYLTFSCRKADALEQSIYVAILLKKDAKGNVFVDQEYNTCSGCGLCSFSESGCTCQEKAPAGDPTWQGRCTHSVSTGPALAKVPLMQD